MDKEEIRRLRHLAGLTQEKLAQELGVAHATVQRWERGKSKPTQLAQKALRQFFKKQLRTRGDTE